MSDPKPIGTVLTSRQPDPEDREQAAAPPPPPAPSHARGREVGFGAGRKNICKCGGEALSKGCTYYGLCGPCAERDRQARSRR